MIFYLHGTPFEIPDEWWAGTGMKGFGANGRSYRCDCDKAQTLPMSEVWTLVRARGFDEARMRSVLKGIADGDPLPPVKVDRPPGVGPAVFRLKDGYHRFMASAAAGFGAIPALEVSYFDLQDDAGIGWDVLLGIRDS